MKYNNITKLANIFYKYSEDYSLMGIVKSLQDIKSFMGRLKYCTTNFKKLGTGSSRIAFLLPDGKVLKLAKNAKGMAQNITESDYGLQGPVSNKIIAADNEHHWWIITNLAIKATPAFFQSQTGLPFEKYCNILQYWNFENKRRNSIKINKPEDYDNILDNNEFVQEILQVIGNGDLAVGDFCKINSYGNVDGKLILVDFGASNDTMEQYYKR
jgi:hypothetical protein